MLKPSLAILILTISFAASAQPGVWASREASERVVRDSINKASIKYYGVPFLDLINRDVFKARLSKKEKETLAPLIFHMSSGQFQEVAKNLTSKYQEILQKDDDFFGSIEELIRARMNRLYFLKEVQFELIQNVFSVKNTDKLGKYVEYVRRIEIDHVSKQVLPTANGAANFQEILKNTELFIPRLDELQSAFKKVRLNGKVTYSLLDEEDEFSEDISAKYNFYLQIGFEYFTAINSAMVIEQNEAPLRPLLMIFPTYFLEIGDPDFSRADTINFAFIGLLAHEFGHGVAYPANQEYRESMRQVSDDEILTIENKIFLPFYQCYENSQQNTDLTLVRLQIGEARADAIAHLVLKYVSESLAINQPEVFLETLKSFQVAGAEKLRDNLDPHPALRNRKNILTGRCTMPTIPAFFRYTEEGLDRGNAPTGH